MRILAAVTGSVLFGPLLLPCPARADCVDYASCIRWVASVATPGCAQSVAVSGNHAFIGECSGVVPGATAGFVVVDITDPLHPLLVTRLEMPGDVTGLALSGTHVYVTESPSAQRPWRGLQVIDVADPAHPRIVGSLGGPGDPWGGGATQPEFVGLAVVGGYAYVATAEDGVPKCELRVIDVSNPALPRLVGRVSFAGSAHGVAVSGDFAYVTSYNQGLRVIDIGDPQRPRLVATVPIPGYNLDVTVSGTYAYLAVWTVAAASLQVVDIADPLEPRLLGTVQIPGVYPICVSMWGNHAILPVGYPQYSLCLIDITDPRNPRVECRVGTPDNPEAVAVAGNHAFVANYDAGLAVLDLTTVQAAPIIGHAATSTWARDVAVSGTTACIADYNLEVIDVADPANPRPVAHLVQIDDWILRVAMAGSYAYLSVNRNGSYGHVGLRVVDIADPPNPRITGWLDLSPASRVGDVALSGTHAYVAAGGVGLDVVDVANPANPRLVGTLTCPEPSGVAVSGSYVYCASSAYRLDVVDVSVPESPRLVGSVGMPGYPWAVAVDGSHAYVSISGIGLVVVDISSPENPRITGSVIAGAFLATNGIEASGGYAYLNCRGVGVLVVDVRKPEQPCIVGNVSLPAEPIGLVLANDLVYIADSQGGLQIVLPQCEAAGRSVATASSGLSPTALPCVFPNPATRQAAIRVTLPVDGRVAAMICDVGGRRVRSLGDELLSRGVHDLAWDGRDDHGRAVAAGVYLARVSTPEGTRTARIVIVR